MFTLVGIAVLVCLNSASTTSAGNNPKTPVNSNVNSLNIYGQSKLLQACLKDQFNKIDDLFNDEEIDVNLAETTSKNSPLHILVERAQFAQAQHEATVKAQADTAARLEKLKAVEGVDVRALTIEEAKRVLTVKVEEGKIDKNDMNSIIKSMEKPKPESTNKNKKKRKQKTINTVNESSSPRAVLKITDLIKDLIDMDVDLESRNDSGWTALNKAIYLASDLPEYPLEVPFMLLKECRALNIPVRQNTPLHFAAGTRIEQGKRALDLVNMLIKTCGNELDYQATNSNGWTSYKVALSAGNLEVAKILGGKTSFLFGWVGWVASISILALLLGVLAFFVYKYKFSNSVKPTDKESDKANLTEAEGSGSTQSPTLTLDQSVSSVTSNDKED